jgi:hypothetical protein
VTFRLPLRILGVYAGRSASGIGFSPLLSLTCVYGTHVVDKLGHLTQELTVLTSASSFWSNWKQSVTSNPFSLSPFVFSVLFLS